MKRRNKFLLLFSILAIFIAAVPHDYHVGIHYLTYNTNSSTFQVTHKVFVDDLESSLRLAGSNVKLEDSLNTVEIKSALQRYFDAHFLLSADEKPVDLPILKSQWEDYHTLIVLRESKKLPKPENLELKDDLFLEVNEDQQHMHYIKVGAEEQSLPTMKGKERVSLSLPEH